MNNLRPLPATLLRTGLKLRSNSIPLAKCRHYHQTVNPRLSVTHKPLSGYTVTRSRALHGSAQREDRIEKSTALLEPTKQREEAEAIVDPTGEDVLKPTGGKGSEGTHFKRESRASRPTTLEDSGSSD